ncbi:MAG: HutD family protein [Flavobacteriales bacterium]|nr:HutD family protein [Flavobacteriales bacterium]MCB9365258.1 HutD family protein [Flavobacteriales bacterium]
MEQLIILKNFETSNWSGGTTTPLFIYPPTSNYFERDFSFRLSTATVNVEQSVFTSLPNVSRKLMVLAGETTLTHKNQHSKKLSKFEIDEFEGDWETTSVGKCTDFNLMTTEATTGELEAVVLLENQSLEFEIQNNWFFIYLYSGEFTLYSNQKKHKIENGNLIVFQTLAPQKIVVEGLKDSELIIVKINATKNTL